MDPAPPLRIRSPEEGGTQISWVSALLVLVVAGVCLLNGLGVLGLVGPDEPRYMAISRAMAATGDWVTPRLYGQPWFEKPVLYYWAAAAAFRVYGTSETAARLPAALAALLATGAVAWAALRAYGLDAAWLTLLMMPATVATVGFARAATPDMLFSALLAAAAVSAAEILEKRRAGTAARLAFGAFLGAATLAKGPAALVLAGGAVLFWTLASRQWRAVFRLTHPACTSAFLVVAVPWYALCAERNPTFLRTFFIEHNFARYVTTIFHHEQRFWFFGPILLAAIVPWTALLLPLAADAIKMLAGGRWADSPALFFGCWAIFPVLFFSFSESKLPGYILPSVPPLVLLLATSLARRLQDARPSRARWPVALVGCTFPALSVAALYWLRGLRLETNVAQTRMPTGLLTLAILGGLACAFLAIAGRPRCAFTATAALMSVLVAGANASLLPRIDPLLSARAAARATTPEALSDHGPSVFKLDRSWEYGLDFYLDRELPEWTPTAARPGWVWTNAPGAAALEKLAIRDSVVLRASPHAWLVHIEP
jgi:4-amino-4-deoxy-L-arabinose transferase-like glycosyltransferase